LTPARHEGGGNRHIGEMDGNRIVDHAANTAQGHSPTVRPRVLVKPTLHLIEPFAETASGGTAILTRTGNRRSASAIIGNLLPSVPLTFMSW
jgi:hypothetical protein